MNYMAKTLTILQIEFHRTLIQHYRRHGQKLMHDSNAATSKKLLSLNRLVDHHGCLLQSLEQMIRC